MSERRADCSEVLKEWEQRRALVQALTEPAAAADVAGEGLRWLDHLVGRIGSAAEVYGVVGHLAYSLPERPRAAGALAARIAAAAPDPGVAAAPPPCPLGCSGHGRLVDSPRWGSFWHCTACGHEWPL